MKLFGKKALVGGFAAAALVGGVAVSSTSAQAQVYYGSGWGYGSGLTVGVGSGYYPSSYRYRDGRYYRRQDNTGAAIAGLVGGLAVGALAAQAYQPYYAQPYSYYPSTTYYGGYGGGYAQNCWIERKRLKTNSGKPLYQDRTVCR